jgi:hypothetical protein
MHTWKTKTRNENTWRAVANTTKKLMVIIKNAQISWSDELLQIFLEKGHVPWS